MCRAVKSLSLCLIVLLLAACGSDVDESQWTTVSSPEGRFKADFPLEPVRQVQRVPAAGNPLELVVYTSEADNEAVSVSYVDYAVEPTGENLKKVLDSAAEGASSAVSGQNLKKTSSTFLERDAIDFTTEAAPNLLTGRAVMVGNRMYILQVVRLNSARSTSFNQLASSFELIPGPTPTATATPSPAITLSVPTIGPISPSLAPISPTDTP